jgi:predicted aconitase with swiveling domain
VAAVIEVKARTIVNREAVGEVLVTPPLSFLGDVDIRSGRIVGNLAGIAGCTVKDRILMMSHTRGSAGAWRFLYQLSKFNTKPAAIITDDPPDPSLVQGAILARIPLVCSPKTSTTNLAATGQRMHVSAREGGATLWVDP